jgi:hypothetical protein
MKLCLFYLTEKEFLTSWSWMEPRHKLKGNSEENCVMQAAISRRLNPTHSSNMGEGDVRELKKGVGRHMLRSGCPKRFWDDCIIREACVRSHTSLDIYGLEGQVPESKVKGETVDISTISEYAWYEWVKFRDTVAKFTVSKIQLVRDLGAAIDIFPAMTRKILKKNWSVMYRSSVRPLTQDEIQSPTDRKEREEFDIALEKKSGPAMNKDDFQYDPDYADFVTPTYDCYEYDEVSPSKIPDIDDIKEELLTHMTNMLDLM